MGGVGAASEGWARGLAVSRGGLAGPVLADAAEFLGAAFVIVELGVDELSQVADAVGLGVLDVLHAPQHILGRLFVLGLGRPQLLLEPEIVALGLVELGDARVVVQAPVLKLLAGVLDGYVSTVFVGKS